MAELIDARKLACPQPVLLTINALDKSDEVVTIVDNETARENVSRMGKNRGFEVTAEQKGDGIYLTLRKTGTQAATKEQLPVASGTVLFIGSDVIGRGDNQLGSLLMQTFFRTLDGLTSKPEAIVFMNHGVKLVANDSLVLEDLRRLEGEGIEILACGTCLSRLELTDKVGVGQVSNMYTISDTMLKAGKVISL